MQARVSSLLHAIINTTFLGTIGQCVPIRNSSERGSTKRIERGVSMEDHPKQEPERDAESEESGSDEAEVKIEEIEIREGIEKEAFNTPDVEWAKHLWDEWKYRHELWHKTFYRSLWFVVTLAIIPWIPKKLKNIEF